jgi:hypothetical protein
MDICVATWLLTTMRSKDSPDQVKNEILYRNLRSRAALQRLARAEANGDEIGLRRPLERDVHSAS